MFRRGLVWLALACAPSLGACSLLLGEGFTDADGDPASDSGTTTPEASANGGDGASPDDAGGGDGAPGPVNDGSPGTDGGNPPPDGGFVCPTATVSFCDDFERTTPKGAWDAVHLNAGGSLVIAAPQGASKRLESAVTTANGEAQLSKGFALTPNKVHLELTVEVSSLASVGNVFITGITMPNGSNPPALVYLFVNQNSFYFVEQVADGVGYNASTVPLSPGTSHRVVMDVTFGGKAQVRVDGAVKVDKNAEAFLVVKPPTVYLGAGAIDGNGSGVALKIDDFVFTAD